jgi:hypothetical protein
MIAVQTLVPAARGRTGHCHENSTEDDSKPRLCHLRQQVALHVPTVSPNISFALPWAGP